ncbi:MAG: hypothetical protein PVJ52_00920 [Candidatus Woesebacteria bacterium]|jgi:Tol biopolymer transport system component
MLKTKNGFAHLFVILIVLAMAAVALFYLADPLQRQKLQTTIKDTSPLIGSGESGLLAYLEGRRALPEGGVIGGELWTINPENLERNKITTNTSIAWIHDWSPDGENIAVVTNEKRDSIISSISVVELKSSSVRQLKEVGSGVRGELFWNLNDKIVYLRSDIPNDKTLSEISIKNGNENDLVVLPEELTNSPQFSPNKQWIAAGDSFFETGKIYSYNPKTETKHTLSGTQAQFGGWVSDKIVYATHLDSGNAIWEVNPDGTNERKLVDLGDAKTSYINISSDGSRIVYVTIKTVGDKTYEQMYSYNYNSGKVSTPYFEENTYTGISGVKVSRNGKYASYHQSSQGVNVIDLESGEIQGVCSNVYCDASWSP